MKNINLLFIVDDDPFYTQILCAHLSKYKFTIETYTNGIDCMNNLYKKPFLMLLDFHLDDPEGLYKTGKDVFQKIRESHPEIIIVMISNQESGKVVLELIQSGVRNYIEKDGDVFKNLDTILEEHASFTNPNNE